MATKKTETKDNLPATRQQKNITEKVLAQVNTLRASSLLRLPKDYSPENALKGAWIILQDVKTKENKRALDHCTGNSIALALLKMVTQGLNPLKKQGSFIPRGNELHWDREYDGDVTLAKRAGLKWIRSRCIYEGDEYITEIDKDGIKTLIEHKQPIENTDNEIKGAYALYEFEGKVQLLEMTMKKIRISWNQGPMKGQSPAHKNFPADMACRTVERKVCKPIIRRADDSELEEYNNSLENEKLDDANKEEIVFDEVEVVKEETTEKKEPKAETKSEPKQPASKTQEPKPEKTPVEEQKKTPTENKDKSLFDKDSKPDF